MQITKNKIKILLFAILLIISNIATYNTTKRKLLVDNLIKDTEFSFTIYQMLNKNGLDATKSFLKSDIKRIFYEVGKSRDVNSFVSICNLKSLDTLLNFDIEEDKINKDMKNILRNGKIRIKNLCKKQ